jgi:hypothetical protein
VRQLPSGEWRADWPEHERYDLGPPSIAWLTWHIGFWWSMALDYSFGEGTLSREKVTWPGSADAVRELVAGLHGAWREKLEHLSPAELQSPERTRWPFRDAAEIGYARFLHAVQASRTPAPPSRSSHRSGA